MRISISGASFAGLATAYWMTELGHEVSVVEVFPGLRTGGTAVDIKGETVEISRRMGILDAIRANRLQLRRWDIKDADDRTARSLILREEGEAPSDEDFEVERTALLQILFDRVKGRCEVVFGDRIVGLEETATGIGATFAKGAPRTFDLVLGCDGMHSGVRKLWFGDEDRFSYFLEQYFSITIVDKLLIERDTAQMFNVPGKAVMLNAYRNSTDIVFCFVAEKEIACDRRDEASLRRILREQMTGIGWRSDELLEEVDASTSFYFDKLAQIRMPAWSRGRVALVGDAAYCPSPAAGMGGSLALDGAAAFADAMRAHPTDHARAFQAYDDALRPRIDAIQAEAVRTGLETLVPRTEEAIRARNAKESNDF